MNINNSFQLVTELGWRVDGGLKGADKINLGQIRYFENTFFGLGLRYNFGTRVPSNVASPVAAIALEETPVPVLAPVYEPVKAAAVPPPAPPVVK